jgi:alpha-amylase
MYYGQEQHLTGNYSPYNRQDLWSTNYDSSAELYTLTATLNKLRNHAISLDGHYVTNWSSVLHTDPSTYVTRKGANGIQVVAVLSNQGQKSGAYTLQVSGAADPGTNLTEVTLCNSTLVAGTNGTIDVPMGQGQPRVYFPTRQLNGSGLCGNMVSDASNSTATSSNPSSTTTSGSAASASKTGAADHLQTPLWLTLAAAVMSALSTL